MKASKIKKLLEKRRRAWLKERAIRSFEYFENRSGFGEWFRGEGRGSGYFNTEIELQGPTNGYDELKFSQNILNYDDSTMNTTTNTITFANSNSGSCNVPIPYKFETEQTLILWLHDDNVRYFIKNAFMSKSKLLNILSSHGNKLTRSLIQMREVRRDRENMARELSSVKNAFLEKIRAKPLTPDVYKYDRAIGIEIECYGEFLKDKLPYWAREGEDGSLSENGVEFRLLLKRSELELRLNKFTNLIKGTHTVNKTCGLHVHLDCRGRSKDEVLKLAKKLDKWLYALREFVPESRRGLSNSGRNFCAFGISPSGNDRYRAVNMRAYYDKKTLEIRLHSGTTDYTKIISWIRLLETLMVIKAPPSGVEGVAALSLIPLCEYERSYWLKRHQELNPRIYASTTPSTESE